MITQLRQSTTVNTVTILIKKNTENNKKVYSMMEIEIILTTIVTETKMSIIIRTMTINSITGIITVIPIIPIIIIIITI